MNVRTYAYGGIGIVAALCGVLAFVFYRMGFVGIAPFVLAILIVGSAIIGFVKSLPRDAKTSKKPKKQKKEQKAQETDINEKMNNE